jgi:hypothetical protein
MRGHLLRELARTAVAQIVRNPRGPKRVIANPRLDMPAANPRRRII